jgi:flagellar hook-associated protein 3 FlgL
MRISTPQLYNNGIGAMLDNQRALTRTQLQLATGRKLVSPSDDPVVSGRLLDLEQVHAQVTRYQKNADQARSQLELEETTLGNVSDLLQRVRELAVGALNGTMGADQRRNIAAEVRQRLADMVALANTRDANGAYLFSGFYEGATEPFTDAGGGTFTYNGDQGARVLQIGANRVIAAADHGDEAFMSIATTSGNQNMFEIVYNLATDLEANTPSSTSLSELDDALNATLSLRARTGARLNAADDQKVLNDAVIGQIEQVKSDSGDLDYAEATSRFNRELLALQASQQTFTRLAGLSLFNFL